MLVLTALAASRADDLSADESKSLRAALHARGMPELVEALGAATGDESRDSLFAAYALEGSRTSHAADRARLLDRALRGYAELIAALESKATRGDLERLALVRRRVACGSIILRFAIAADLDRFEITSGLDAPRQRLRQQLDAAVAAFTKAESDLKPLVDALASDEERFLLLGTLDVVQKLHRECTLNLAWAVTWRSAMDAPATTSIAPLAEAVRRFDAIAAASPDGSERHSATLGAAAALRWSQRFDEALQTVDRLLAENPPYVMLVRGHVERGRNLIAAERFAEARKGLERLAAVAPEQIPAEHAGAKFYVWMAPLLIADSFLLEAADARLAPEQRGVLREHGINGLGEIAARGGEWPDIVDVYLAARGVRRDPAERTAPELAAAAQRGMRAGRYDEALPLWQSAAQKLPPGARRNEAAYNIGVCHFQLGRVTEAASAFLEVVRAADAAGQGKAPAAREDEAAGEPLAEQAAYFAYRCRLQTAQASRDPADALALVEACRLLLQHFPHHRDAGEIAWVEALALQEAGKLSDAAAAFARVPRESAHYWEARQRAAICRQTRFDARAAAASAPSGPPTGSADAETVARDWQQLASDAREAARRGDQRVPAGLAQDADLNAAELLSGEPARRYRDALAILDSIEARTGISDSARGRVLSIRIRCFRGLGQLEQAAAVLDEYLKAVPAEQVGGVLMGLAAGMESEIEQHMQSNRPADAKRLAAAAIPTLQELLKWIEGPGAGQERAAGVPVVRLSLVRVLDRAGRSEEALGQLDRLMAESPDNGTYLRLAAMLHEDIATRSEGDARKHRVAMAETLWEKLLADAGLRDTAPQVYWEARYHWLRLRLERGDADEVVRGIESERAWYPSLGGPPWQGRLLELAEQARRRKK